MALAKKIFVLGAGPTGLAFAEEVLRRDPRVELKVFDALDRVGGLAGSENILGIYADCGPHIYHTSDPKLQERWTTDFGDLLEEKEFYSKNYKDGVLYDYPLSRESINNFEPELRDKVLSELDNRKPENMKRATNFKEVVSAIVGPTLQEMFFEAYTKKLWGIETTKMSAKWAPKRIEIREKHSSFWYNQYSAAAKYGSGRIMERIAANIQRMGGEVKLGCSVSQIRHSEGCARSLELRTGETFDVSDALIVSTIPLNKLANVLGESTTLLFNSVMLLYVVFDCDYILPDGVQSIYFAHDEALFHRVSEQKRFSQEGIPADKTILTFEISYGSRPELGEMDEKLLAKTVIEQFESMGFCDSKDVNGTALRRWDSVNPILTQGFEIELSRINSTINRVDNILSVGGAAEYVYGDVQVMFAKAYDTAEMVMSAHYNINKNRKRMGGSKFNSEVEFESFLIGRDNPCAIIAEVGINHNGSLSKAKELIRTAHESGADLVKIQTFDALDRVSKFGKSSRYADKTLDMEETLFEMFERVALTEAQQTELFQFAQELGIFLFSTPFSERNVDFLEDIGVAGYKIASFDLVNLPLLRYVASKQKPLILSTGMAGMAEVEEALEAVSLEGNKNVVLLHCVSSYPASPLEANLKAIQNMKGAFGLPVGYSDHTVGLDTAKVAVCLGAAVIEKHFTLDHSLEGSDHILSADRRQLQELVQFRDHFEICQGDGIKRIQPSEYVQINEQRKSVYVSRDLIKGEVLDLNNVTVQGPGHGLPPKFISLILGRQVTRSVKAGMPLTWDDVLTNE